MFDEMWSEIQDMPGEIFDLTDESINQFLEEEEKYEKFDVEDYLKSDYDY